MDSYCTIRRLRVPRGGPLDAAPAPRDLRRMNKRRIFIIVVVALAAAAAMLRAPPSAPAEREVVAPSYAGGTPLRSGDSRRRRHDAAGRPDGRQPRAAVA